MMSLQSIATQDAAKAFTAPKPAKRPRPFSLRLNEKERIELEARANGTPLGTYIKRQVFGAHTCRPVRKVTHNVKNPEALAKALALLGQSRIASNLNQLAKAANIGTLPLTPDVIDDIEEACAIVAEIRALLVEALGLKTGGR